VEQTEIKHCVVCGRAIEWRKKWERDWQGVKYCSKACRSRGVTQQDWDLEHAILSLLEKRRGGGSICPSEAARLAGGDDWRALMNAARMAARRLSARGGVEITQSGRPVDPSTAKGPIRIRLSQHPPAVTRKGVQQ